MGKVRKFDLNSTDQFTNISESMRGHNAHHPWPPGSSKVAVWHGKQLLKSVLETGKILLNSMRLLGEFYYYQY